MFGNQNFNQPMNPSGNAGCHQPSQWNGWYEQGGNKTNMTLNNFNVDKHGKVFGSGSDATGQFSIQGTVDKSGKFKFNKKYPSHSVVYDGNFNGSAINGRWSIPGNCDGSFELMQKAIDFHGHYYQNNNPSPMNFKLMHNNGVISGLGKDNIGFFVINGNFNGQNMNFEKSYVGQHSVNYSGQYHNSHHGCNINGKWTVPGNCSGKFELKSQVPIAAPNQGQQPMNPGMGGQPQFPNQPGMGGKGSQPPFPNQPGMGGMGGQHKFPNQPGMGGQFPNQQGNMGGMGGQFPNQQGNMGGMGGHFPNQQGNMGGMGGQFPNQQGNIGGMGGHFPNKQGNMGGMGGQFPNQQGNIGGMGGQFPNQQGNMGGIGGQFQNQQGNMGGMGGQFPNQNHMGGQQQFPNQPGMGGMRGQFPNQQGNMGGMGGQFPNQHHMGGQQQFSNQPGMGMGGQFPNQPPAPGMGGQFPNQPPAPGIGGAKSYISDSLVNNKPAFEDKYLKQLDDALTKENKWIKTGQTLTVLQNISFEKNKNKFLDSSSNRIDGVQCNFIKQALQKFSFDKNKLSALQVLSRFLPPNVSNQEKQDIVSLFSFNKSKTTAKQHLGI